MFSQQLTVYSSFLLNALQTGVAYLPCLLQTRERRKDKDKFAHGFVICSTPAFKAWQSSYMCELQQIDIYADCSRPLINSKFGAFLTDSCSHSPLSLATTCAPGAINEPTITPHTI